MSETRRTYTERDVVLAKREGFMRGRRHDGCSLAKNVGSCEYCEAEARIAFPLPKVTRPRLVKDEWDVEWRIDRDSCLEFRDHRHPDWQPSTRYGQLLVDGRRVALWADLLANPTEEVEDTGDV